MSQPRRVVVVGALGRMGQHVREALRDEPSLRLAAALESPGHAGIGSDLGGGVIVQDDPKQALRGCDVAIEFSVPAAALALARVAAEEGVALVSGTTGLSASEREELAEIAKRIPVLATPNFSVAVNVLFHLTRRAAELLGPGYDAEILEVHHRTKVDAPSGTALTLAKAVEEGRRAAAAHVLAREGLTGPRPSGAIGLQALRGGDNPGEHTVMFLGVGERLELAHRAATRDHFARGALRAALWLRGRTPGLYDMEQVLGLR